MLTLRRRIEVAPSYPFKDTGLPLIPFPDGMERVTAPNYVFPNVEIDLVRDNISSIIYEPIAPNRTIAKMGFFFVGDAATSDAHAEGRKTAMGPMARPHALERREGRRAQSGLPHMGGYADRQRLTCGGRQRVLAIMGVQSALLP